MKVDDIIPLAREIEQNCPCGARPESPETHPHVPWCPVYRLLKMLGVETYSLAEEYAKAVGDIRKQKRRPPAG